MTLGKYLALVVLGCYCVFSAFAYGRVAPSPHGYALEDIAALNAISAAPVHLSKAEALARKQAEAYADVYGITAENMNSFREWW